MGASRGPLRPQAWLQVLALSVAAALVALPAGPALADGAAPSPASAAAPASDPPPLPPTLQFSAGPFTDLLPGYWALPAIQDLARAGLALAPAPQTFDPYGAETRGAWTEQVALALLPAAPPPPAAPPFLDVPATLPGAAEIAAAAQAGWVIFPTNYGFEPSAPITRQEAFALLGTALFGQQADPGAAALPFTDAAAVAPWARGPILALARAGYIAGDGSGNLDPLDALQRADAAVLLDGLLQHLITAGGQRYRVVSVLRLRATAYGNGEGLGGHTATGAPTGLGEAAADPAALPYGTELYVTGYDGHGYLPAGGLLERIEDTGELGPGDIDLYMPASGIWPYLQFGVQYVTGYVLAALPAA